EFFRARKILDASPPGPEWPAQPLCSLADQLLIRVTAAPAQLMVKMSDHELPAMGFGEAVEHLEQDHRVESAGNRDQNFLPRPEQPPLRDYVINLTDELNHTRKSYVTGFGTDRFRFAVHRGDDGVPRQN